MKRTTILSAALLGCTLLSTFPARAAYEFYVTIEGTKQGKFKGESLREAHKAKLAGLAFDYSVSSPRDVATGLASGKRQHKPVVFTKEWGAATPQIFQAAVTNEVLKTVLFEFYKTSPEGTEYVYQTVKLTNASVSNLHQYSTMTSGTSAKITSSYDIKELEEVSLTFQRIEISNLDGKTQAVDDWSR